VGSSKKAVKLEPIVTLARPPFYAPRPVALHPELTLSPGRGQSRLLYRLLIGTAVVGEREASPLAPWLQPGGQVLQNDSLNRFQRFLLILLQTRTVRNGSLSMLVCYHRAEAAVLIRSLRVPSPYTKEKRRITS